MAFGKIGETLSALQLFDLVNADLEKVEREIGLESVASVEAINYINQYLQAGGGKRLRAGELVLTGSLVQTIWLKAGDKVAIDLSGLGSVTVDFA